jgi:hypothetical protein
MQLLGCVCKMCKNCTPGKRLEHRDARSCQCALQTFCLNPVFSHVLRRWQRWCSACKKGCKQAQDRLGSGNVSFWGVVVCAHKLGEYQGAIFNLHPMWNLWGHLSPVFSIPSKFASVQVQRGRYLVWGLPVFSLPVIYLPVICLTVIVLSFTWLTTVLLIDYGITNIASPKLIVMPWILYNTCKMYSAHTSWPLLSMCLATARPSSRECMPHPSVKQVPSRSMSGWTCACKSREWIFELQSKPAGQTHLLYALSLHVERFKNSVHKPKIYWEANA